MENKEREEREQSNSVERETRIPLNARTVYELDRAENYLKRKRLRMDNSCEQQEEYYIITELVRILGANKANILNAQDKTTNYKQIVDGYEIIDGQEWDSFSPNLFPLITGLGSILTEETMNAYLHEFFGDDANFYPGYGDIGLGESKGWASASQQKEFLLYILNRIDTQVFYEYKGNVGKREIMKFR